MSTKAMTRRSNPPARQDTRSESRELAVAGLSDIQVPAPAAERGIEPHQWRALKEAIFPRASDQMVLLAVDYCRARRLDPLKRPVHIVKAWDSEAGKEIEQIWEGINSHRVTAARTGEYAGADAPVYGPPLTKTVGTTEMTFPETVSVTVYRMVRGRRCAFTGVIRWVETVSTRRDGSPTYMWRKRPYSQAAKCAEAEALRKAFPEELGDRPTLEEGGEVSDDDVLDLPAEDWRHGLDAGEDAQQKPATSRVAQLENMIEEYRSGADAAERSAGPTAGGNPPASGGPPAGRAPASGSSGGLTITDPGTGQVLAEFPDDISGRTDWATTLGRLLQEAEDHRVAPLWELHADRARDLLKATRNVQASGALQSVIDFGAGLVADLEGGRRSTLEGG